MEEKTLSYSIKSWSDDDKPREKLLKKGVRTLSHAELIAILLGSGSRNESAVDLARKILLSTNNSLHELGRLSTKQLTAFKGVGEAKAVSIAAALELGRRRNTETHQKTLKIRNSKDAYRILYPMLAELQHEEFWIVYLNNANKVMETSQLSKGGITGTVVDVRLVLKRALELNAVALVLGHNHPSGALQPSLSDRAITHKLVTAADALDIRVLDHLIITQKTYFSFADEKMI